MIVQEKKYYFLILNFIVKILKKLNIIEINLKYIF